MPFKLKPVLAALLAVGLSTPAMADDAEMLRQMQEQMKQMQAQIETLSKKLAEQGDKQDKVVAQVAKSEADDKSRAKAIKLYGQLRLSADNYSDDFGTGKSDTTIKSNASRIGVKGEIPTSLGDTSLIYQAEILYGAADNAGLDLTKSEIAWREGYAGLKGGWGQARLGRIDVPYKTTLTAIDPWNDNAPQSRGFKGTQGSSSLHSSYFSNTAEYVSPSFNGFKAGVWYSTQLDGETNAIHDADPIKNFTGGEAKGLGVKFDKGPWYVGADVIDIDADAVSSGVANGNGWQIAGRYKAEKWSVAAMYEDVEDLGLGKNTYLNGTYKLGKTTLIAALGRNRDGTAVGSAKGFDTWSLGAKYALTKDSELFAAYVDRDDNNGKDYQIVTLGINAKFGY